jgi:hypothetical protein
MGWAHVLARQDWNESRLLNSVSLSTHLTEVQQYLVTPEVFYLPPEPGVLKLRAAFAGEAGNPARLCRGGKRKLTESAREFPKDSTRRDSVRVASRGAGARSLGTLWN